jgi:hypothetical protein
MRTLATSAALLLSIGTLVPATAYAAASTTIYVNNLASCSDSGSGTQTTPFCTIQAGVNAAVAGDTVLVAPSRDYAPVTITRSGTVTAPITITAAVPQSAFVTSPANTNVPAFTITGASYVTVKGFETTTNGGQMALIEGSSHVTIDSLTNGAQTADSQPVIYVTSTSSAVTISRNWLYSVVGSAVQHSASILVDPGSSGDTITTNYVSGWSSGIVVNGAANTIVTSNTVYQDCNQGIVLSGASTGATIENNIVDSIEDRSSNSSCPTTTSPEAGIEVDSAAVSGTTLDYNIDYQTYPSATPYIWAGVKYSSAAALHSATTQAAHDLNADPGSVVLPNLQEGSNAINSANSNAPGELSTDLYGNARTNDPNDPDTGAGTYTYYDRGADQYEDPLAPDVTFNAYMGTAPATFTATESIGAPGWANPTQWSIDFGDGSAPTITASPAIDLRHTYTTPGTYSVTVTVTDGYGSDGRGSSTGNFSVQVLAGDVFHPVAPTRILDTRNGTGTGGVKAAVKPNSALVLQVDGASPLPASGVAAVALNLTVTDPTGFGNVSAYADGSTRPSTSNVNFTAGQTVANQVIAQVGSDGKIDFYNEGTGTVDLIADVAGYYGVGTGDGLTTIGDPTRVLDTRNGTGTGGVVAAVPAKGTLTLTSANSNNQLYPGYTSVMNVTVTNAKGGGYLTVYPDGMTRPGTSSLNFNAGQTVANEVDVQTGNDGSIDFYNNASAPVDVIADVLGTFSPSFGSGYFPVSPLRVLDTRSGIGAPKGPVSPYGTVTPSVVRAGVPSTAAVVAANVTVTTPTNGGDIEVYPAFLSAPPGVSTLNFSKGATVANATTMSLEDDQLKLYNQSAGSSQLLFDVFGYYQ